MKTWYYLFADNYECWTTGKMDKVSLSWEVSRHGKVMMMKTV